MYIHVNQLAFYFEQKIPSRGSGFHLMLMDSLHHAVLYILGLREDYVCFRVLLEQMGP